MLSTTLFEVFNASPLVLWIATTVVECMEIPDWCARKNTIADGLSRLGRCAEFTNLVEAVHQESSSMNVCIYASNMPNACYRSFRPQRSQRRKEMT